jgi:hypothetical protein
MLKAHSSFKKRPEANRVMDCGSFGDCSLLIFHSSGEGSLGLDLGRVGLGRRPQPRRAAYRYGPQNYSRNMQRGMSTSFAYARMATAMASWLTTDRLLIDQHIQSSAGDIHGQSVALAFVWQAIPCQPDRTQCFAMQLSSSLRTI